MMTRDLARQIAKSYQVCMPWKQCDDCDSRTYRAFMILDDLWESLGLPHYGAQLCLDCVEKRLDRKLTEEDFCDYMVNEGLRTISAETRHTYNLAMGIHV